MIDAVSRLVVRAIHARARIRSGASCSRRRRRMSICPGGLFRPARHWLTLQSRATFLILRLNDDDWRQVVETVTGRTGVASRAASRQPPVATAGHAAASLRRAGCREDAPAEAGTDARSGACRAPISCSTIPACRASTRGCACVDAECRLQDAGSRFGTFLNGELVRDEVVGRARRHDQARRGRRSSSSSTCPSRICSPRTTRSPKARARSSGPIAPERRRSGAGDGHLIRLLADVNRTLLTTQSLTDVLNRVVDLAFGAVPAERAFLMLRDSADEALVGARAAPSRRLGAAQSDAQPHGRAARHARARRDARHRRDHRSRPRHHRQHPAVQHPVVHVRAALEPRGSHRRALCRQPEERAVQRGRSRRVHGADQRRRGRHRAGAAVRRSCSKRRSGASGCSAITRRRSSAASSTPRKATRGLGGAGARRHGHVLRPRRVHDAVRADAAGRSRRRCSTRSSRA